jgi:hypothetical protein
MNRSVLIVAALATLAAAPASAQYYGPYGGYGDEEEAYPPPRRYREVPTPPYETYRPYGYGERRYGQQTPLGYVCVTSRGDCDASGALPLGTPCSCFIPGFGRKRGAVGF